MSDTPKQVITDSYSDPKENDNMFKQPSLILEMIGDEIEANKNIDVDKSEFLNFVESIETASRFRNGSFKEETLYTFMKLNGLNNMENRIEMESELKKIMAEEEWDKHIASVAVPTEIN